ncbi:MAG: hypothetical protein A2W93_10375 [Bacteroidetes bacterium GWF2_43_63]|nr:MAG: hypothetical protein A2W94_02095 [Bacteroidetes bacterium GWE2_42_42]OFY52926.1 MAG: hypothetical protein A2W93_10375 [Bacteroidetes bacterium GWF2_43_63]HBG70134.1 membrane or secreted protein [Bacteroidales bacterium]HCB62259.1 membrane or secreted protein [Bacteroidales bacterium]
MNLLVVILICVALVGLAVAGIAIKMFLIKGGEFKKQCSTKDPKTGESIGCSCGGHGKTCDNS